MIDNDGNVVKRCSPAGCALCDSEQAASEAEWRYAEEATRAELTDVWCVDALGDDGSRMTVQIFGSKEGAEAFRSTRWAAAEVLDVRLVVIQRPVWR